MLRPSVRILLPVLTVAALAGVAPGVSAARPAPPAPVAGPTRVVVQGIFEDVKARADQLNSPALRRQLDTVGGLLKQVPATDSGQPAVLPASQPGLVDRIVSGLTTVFDLEALPATAPRERGVWINQKFSVGGEEVQPKYVQEKRTAKADGEPYRVILDGLVYTATDRTAALPAGDLRNRLNTMLDTARNALRDCASGESAPAADSGVDCSGRMQLLPGEVEQAMTLTARPDSDATGEVTVTVSPPVEHAR